MASQPHAKISATEGEGEAAIVAGVTTTVPDDTDTSDQLPEKECDPDIELCARWDRGGEFLLQAKIRNGIYSHFHFMNCDFLGIESA